MTPAKAHCLSDPKFLSRDDLTAMFDSITDPCLIFESGSISSQFKHIYSVLHNDFNRRPIIDQEIALAIVEGSCSLYCNATKRVGDCKLSCEPDDFSEWDAPVSLPNNSKRLGYVWYSVDRPISIQRESCIHVFSFFRETEEPQSYREPNLPPTRQYTASSLLPSSNLFFNLKKAS